MASDINREPEMVPKMDYKANPDWREVMYEIDGSKGIKAIKVWDSLFKSYYQIYKHSRCFQ